uniref:Large ribosomal subunit protein uL22c n=2 Tax=Dipsacus asper TaxID=516548 RepID=A0A385JPT1_9DIPS|nr:ribosomal protein L22 [Dipsacus asper]YP_009531636.1 ribosomal protein L22 [Dipsacus asper]YP_010413994.1 ribosomal protein L22 [Dipsacus asperoides]YP_010414019.1 ribosomal protein L22 [Dipsacus asperoides]AXZ62385.1 ribosomal protein L22 [Dipsacus asper]AXZ62411.1 ribosomal protein L22 [Dipsacus asper]URQ20851.1 ribosomal protein L22 [Dipsacus asperoides]URQ20876.1 ribosomal protein L22 [Dipsacus asperoides]
MFVEKQIEVCALGQHIAMSAHKARRVIDQIRGRSYEETLMILELMPYRACYPILKLVYSAGANASYSMGSNEANLIISKAEVNEGTTVKKLKPRARGRSYPIKRPTCHITIEVKDLSLPKYVPRDYLKYEPRDYLTLTLPKNFLEGSNKPILKNKYTDVTYPNMYNLYGHASIKKPKSKKKYTHVTYPKKCKKKCTDATYPNMNNIYGHVYMNVNGGVWDKK